MIHLLVVEDEAGRPLSPPASFEILRADSAAQALEKLSRNRRIDAVLFFQEGLARETAGRIAEEDPAAPPLFFAGRAAIPAVTDLGEAEVFSALEASLGER